MPLMMYVRVYNFILQINLNNNLINFMLSQNMFTKKEEMNEPSNNAAAETVLMQKKAKCFNFSRIFVIFCP